MSGSLARRVARRTSWLLAGALAVVGLTTGTLMHGERVQALDRTLLAAAYASARPDGESWQVEGARSPVEVWVEDPAASTMPRPWVHEALAFERPVYLDQGGDRLLLLVAEIDLPPELRPKRVPGVPHDEQADEQHFLVIAKAPRVTLSASVGPFALIYLVVSFVVAVGCAAVQRRVLRASFRPMDRARAEVAAVVVPGQGARLTEGGAEELDTLLRAMNALLDRLDAAAGAQARFTAHAAHELRTPVTVMLGEVEIALRQARTVEEYRTLLESLHEEAGHLRDLVAGLMDLARLDGPGQDPNLRADVGEVMETVLGRERAGLEAAGCTVHSARAPDLGTVRGDPALLRVALSNLLRNAATYAAGSTVTLGATGDAEGVTITVDDTGPGIPEAEREAVFDRLFRGAGANNVSRTGLGLGLSLAREVARRYGGDCVVEASDGGGCRARLTLLR